jgi:hypothetical protein
MLIKELDVSDLDRARMTIALEQQWLAKALYDIKQRIHEWKVRSAELELLRRTVEARS